MSARHKVQTCLWFDHQALEAAEFYTSLLPDSRIGRVIPYAQGQDIAPPGAILLVEFTLAGTPYQALNGGAMFPPTEAASISVATRDQAETDALWDALTTGGGAPSQCGWLRDRFGVSWQIVPRRALDLMAGPRAAQVWPVLTGMTKIKIAALEAAAR